jgi:hypothetical protein
MLVRVSAIRILSTLGRFLENVDNKFFRTVTYFHLLKK